MDLLYNIKQYFSFSSKEFKHLAITAVVIGFFFSFTEWGVDKFDPRVGFISLLNAFLIVIVSLLVHIVAQKTLGIARGYNVEYKLWLIGLLIGILFVIYSNGNWLFAVPGVFSVSMIDRLRLGKRRQSEMYSDGAWIGFIGPFANIVFAMIFKAIQEAGLATPLIDKLILVNILLAVYSILPIPPLGGFKIFYYSRTLGIFSMILIFSMSALLYAYSFISTFIFGVILAAAIAIIYFVKVELTK